MYLNFIYDRTKTGHIEAKSYKYLHNISKEIFETSHFGTQSSNDLKKSCTAIEQVQKLLHTENSFDKETAVNDIDTFMFAGSSDVTMGISNCILLLAMYPHVQERLFLDMKSLFTTPLEKVTDQKLLQLPYLTMVVKECLRLLPVNPIVAREVIQDTKIGTLILIQFFTNFNDLIIF